jgi:hypothetical protein
MPQEILEVHAKKSSRYWSNKHLVLKSQGELDNWPTGLKESIGVTPTKTTDNVLAIFNAKLHKQKIEIIRIPKERQKP